MAIIHMGVVPICLLHKKGNTTEIESKVCNTLKRKKIAKIFHTKKPIANPLQRLQSKF